MSETDALRAAPPAESPLEARAGRRRGRLRIHLGYASGVGKTYAMLAEARARRDAGVDVVLGFVSPRSDPRTLSLAEGLERLPTPDFDVGAALERAPALLVVDDLAASNPTGSRHASRWMDVEELLAAGIDVFTTLDVHELEGLGDVVARIRGTRPRATVPDRVLDAADEVELIDVPPGQLSLRQGTADADALPQRAQLHALREVALRRIADRVHEQVAVARRGRSGRPAWATREHLLVCVGPSPTSANVIRSARRLAVGLRGGFMAACVLTGRESPEARARIDEHLALASRLGAETIVLEGESVVREVLELVARRGVTKVVLGRAGPPRRGARARRGGLVEELIRRSGEDVDVYVVRGREDGEPPARPARHESSLGREVRVALEVVAAMTAATGLALALSSVHLSHANIVMTLLLGVTAVAARRGFPAAWAASLLGVLSFNFFFTAPRFTLRMKDPNDVFTLAVMLVIALTVGSLAARLRRHSERARLALQRSEALLGLSRRLAGAADRVDVVRAGKEQLETTLGLEVGVLLPDASGALEPAEGGDATFLQDAAERDAARLVFAHGRRAGASTDLLPERQALYLPLDARDGRFGVLAVRPAPGAPLASEPRRVAEAFASQIAGALERDALATRTREVLLAAETERTRSTILSTISHDLRTPLATISGASSSLAENRGELTEATRRELATAIFEESTRLARLVDKVLQMTRLESGAVTPALSPTPVEEVVGSALERLRGRLSGTDVEVELPETLPLVPMDGVLVEQVLINLLENALHHGGAGVRIGVRASADERELRIDVRDDGPGLAPGSLERVFDKFHRGAGPERGHLGAGLGLAICRAIARAHGGDVRAIPGNGGACFRLTLPRAARPSRGDS